MEDKIRKYDLCDLYDFSGLHISVAKMLVKCVIKVSYRYPRLRSRMNFIGSRKGFLSLLERLADCDISTVKRLGIQYIADDDLIRGLSETSKKLIEMSSSGDGNVLAQAITVMGILDGIILDEQDFGSRELHQARVELENAVATGQSPQGCASVEAVVYHEIGHLLDYLCDISENDEVLAEFSSCSADEITEALSYYASTSIQEYLAEGFAESMANPLPRKTARQILSYFDNAYSALQQNL